jgi:hypothetical protein
MNFSKTRFGGWGVLVLGCLALLAAAPGPAAAQTPRFQSLSFLNDAQAASITITNAAAAPLGGFTNTLSWSYGGVQATNNINLTWTNASGTWVIPTNNTPGSVTGISFVTNNSTKLAVDLPLWVGANGTVPITVTTNNFAGDATAYALTPASISCRVVGAASAANTLNLIFVGLPDGTNEPSSATVGAIPAFQWGITVASGTTVVSTNLPMWKFAGCGKIRLRSATLTTTTAANIGVAITDLNLNGFPQ